MWRRTRGRVARAGELPLPPHRSWTHFAHSKHHSPTSCHSTVRLPLSPEVCCPLSHPRSSAKLTIRLASLAAGRGIGAGVAQELARLGAAVAVHYNGSQAKADAVVDAIKKAGGEAISVRADLTTVECGQVIVKAVVEWKGKIDSEFRML